MSSLLLHLFVGIIQRFFLGIGGLTRWLIFRAYNALYFEKFPKDLDYYINHKNDTLDKNGFSVQNKNFFVGIVLLILLLLLLEKSQSI
jgi:hypothetical protein